MGRVLGIAPRIKRSTDVNRRQPNESQLTGICKRTEGRKRKGPNAMTTESASASIERETTLGVNDGGDEIGIVRY